MQRLMIDMDETICGDGIMFLLNEYLGTKLSNEDIKEYYIQNLVPANKKNDFIEYLTSKNFYDYSIIYDNAYEVLKELNDNYELHICTSYIMPDKISYCADLLKYKFEYLQKEFPFIKADQIIFANDKNIIDFDIKIDDKIANLDGAKTKILYTCYHNQDVTDEELTKRNIIRANNWLDIKKILLEK